MRYILTALAVALVLCSAALADTISGSGGIASCSGDLSVNCTQVLSTHIARRVAPDASDQLVYALDEASGAGTIVNTGALGATGNLTGNSPGTGWQSGYVGVFQNAYFFKNPSGTTQQIVSATPSSVAEYSSVSISAWVYMTGTPVNNGMLIAGKKYANDTTWVLPHASLSLTLIGTASANTAATVQCEITVAAAERNLLPAASSVGLTGWHHVGCTYDSVSGVQTMYIDGIDVGSQTAAAGVIDYGTHGPWMLGGLYSATVAGMFGLIDDVRVANVVRPLSYFQNVWRVGMQIGGN